MRNFLSAEGVGKSTALLENSAPRRIAVIIFGGDAIKTNVPDQIRFRFHTICFYSIYILFKLNTWSERLILTNVVGLYWGINFHPSWWLNLEPQRTAFIFEIIPHLQTYIHFERFWKKIPIQFCKNNHNIILLCDKIWHFLLSTPAEGDLQIFSRIRILSKHFFQIKKKNIFLTWIILKREKIQGPTRSVPVPVIFVRCFLLSEKVTVAESETYFYLEWIVEQQLVICGSNVSWTNWVVNYPYVV